MIFGYQSLLALMSTPANVAWGVVWAMLSHTVERNSTGFGVQRFYSWVAMVDANRADIHYVRIPMAIMEVDPRGQPWQSKDARIPGVALRGHALIVDHIRSIAPSATTVAGLPGFPTGVQMMESAAECIEWDSNIGEWVYTRYPATTEELLGELNIYTADGGEGGEGNGNAST